MGSNPIMACSWIVAPLSSAGSWQSASDRDEIFLLAGTTVTAPIPQ